ncbi:type IV conjugative transfer system lipoprotein TraV [Parasutterella sp.]|uniref:type IV conjugative transfer system lipoprotein TraV n=1 Tax=Parasutterella sp. TaxID=2049037 RepID=UPI003520B088
MRRTVLAIASLTSAFVLSGCSYLNVGEENFSCSGMPGDPKCMSTSQMYQYSVNGGENGYVLSGSGDKTNVVFGSAGKEKEVYAPYTTMQKTPSGVETDGQVIVGDDIIVQNFVTPKLPYAPVPVRTPSMVMRIWIASYTDLNGDLNSPGYVYTEIEPRKWIMNPAQAKNSSNFQPLVKKVPVQRSELSSTTNDSRKAENSSNPATVNNLERLKQSRSR